jgi:heme-degrading monooxygenase HmoA
MQIISVVEGKISKSKMTSFETSFLSLRQRPKPPGWLRSSLLKDSKNPTNYRIETVWEDMESFENMICNTPRPVATELFENVGAKASVKIFELSRVLP